MKSLVRLFTAALFVTGLSAPVESQAQFRSAVRPPAVRPPAVRPPTVRPPAVRTPSVRSSVTPRAASATAKPASTPSTLTRPKPATVSQRSAVVARKNGNSLSSNRPQHMYGIFETNKNTGATRIHKIGVSGGSTRSGSQLPASMQRRIKAPTRDYSNRAIPQVKQLNRAAAETNKPVKYTTRNLKRIPGSSNSSFTARQSIIASEKQAVTGHVVKRGTPPPGNKLPHSAPFSRVGGRK